MKYLVSTFTLCFILCACAQLRAQASFTLTPPVVQTMVPDSITDAEAQNVLTNISSNPITVRWTRSVMCTSLPSSLSQICDPNLCYLPSVNTKTFTLAPGASGTIIVHYLKNAGQSGAAIILLHFENVNNPADSLTGHYLFNSCQSSGSDEPSTLTDVRVYPNPAAGYFALENDQFVANIRVYALDGKQIASYQAIPGTQYPTEQLPAGKYVLGLFDDQGRAVQALELVKQ